MRPERLLPVLLLGAPFDEADLDGLAAPILGRVKADLGVELIPTDLSGLARTPLPALLLLTGGTEQAALAASAEFSGPLLVLAHGARNALPAAMEVVAALQARERQARLVHPDDVASEEILGSALSARDLAAALRGHRIGWIGGAAPWLIASSPDPATLEEKLGLEIRELPLQALRDRLPQDATAALPGKEVDLAPGARYMARRVLHALECLMDDEGLTALSIACFELLADEMTACWALAELASRGVPAGCEGDLTALVALIVAQALCGQQGFLANPADIDAKRGRVVLSHCTAPRSLLSGYRLRTHFESGLGLAIEGKLRPGPYTLVRFGGRALEHGFFIEGTVLEEQVGREDLCRTQALFKLPRGAAALMLRRPLGNHHVLVPGHHRPALEVFHELFLS